MVLALATSLFAGCSSDDKNTAVTLLPGDPSGGNPLPSDSPTPTPTPTPVPTPIPAAANVLTFHNDNARTGQNLQETLLTPANVKSATFGKLFSFTVDGYVYAQPLYASKVLVNGQLRNVVYVATEHNSVYAFDADNQMDTPLWQVSFIGTANGITSTTVPSKDTASPPGYTGPGPVKPEGCMDLTPEIGITGTPVIDPVTGTLYVVAKTKEVTGRKVAYEHRLHALDIATGNPRPGSGQKLQASVPGTSLPNDGKGRVLFKSLRQNQRAALLLHNNVISIAFSSHCVIRPYQGWVLAYDAATLAQVGAFNVVPNDPIKGKGGIWHSGSGPAADADGNVFVMTGDGPFNVDVGGDSFSDSVLKLKLTSPSLTVADYFTPHNQFDLEAANADLSAGGPMLLPEQPGPFPNLMVSIGKQAIVYLINRDDMGKYQTGSDSQIVQSFSVCGGGACGVYSSPAYFNNTVYTAAFGDGLRAFSLRDGQFSLPSLRSQNTFRWPGATPVISANGSSNGIVWALEVNGSGAPAVLHAYPAENVALELYNSNQNVARDDPGPAVKFTVPVVANGKEYVPSQGQVSVFGLLPQEP